MQHQLPQETICWYSSHLVYILEKMHSIQANPNPYPGNPLSMVGFFCLGGEGAGLSTFSNLLSSNAPQERHREQDFENFQHKIYTTSIHPPMIRRRKEEKNKLKQYDNTKTAKQSFVKIFNTTTNNDSVHKLSKMGMFDVNDQHYHLLINIKRYKKQRWHCQ